MRNKKNKHNFWKRLHFKYRLSVMNENTLEEIWRIKASMFSGLVIVSFFALFLIAITSVIIIATPIRYYLPGYLDAEVRENAIRYAIIADSLEQQIKHQQAYTSNLQKVFAGTMQIDSVKMVDTVSVSEKDPLLQKSKAELEFTKKYEEEEKYNLSNLTSSSPMEGITFYKPVKGIVVDKYKGQNNDFGIKIKTLPKETVVATLDGTIIFAGYDIKTGYTIQIQHKNGFVSIYRNNTMLLKNAGDRVRAGEAIATIEGEKESKENTLLEFELWYRGNAVNPENYISFLH